MTIKFWAKQIYWITFVILTLSITAFAQTDAERFAEGRVAFDKFKDCPGALQALEAVSAEGRKNPLWVFYMAKATECLNKFDDALRFYEEYDRMIPGQAAVLDKIGELRYQLGLRRRKEEADLARKQKEEDDKLALEREIEREKADAKSRLSSVLQALNDELARNPSWQGKNYEERPMGGSITISSNPTCRFPLTVHEELQLVFDDGGTRLFSFNQRVTLNLTNVTNVWISSEHRTVQFFVPNDHQSLTLYGDNYGVYEGSWENVRIDTGHKEKRLNGEKREKGDLSTDRKYYELELGPSRSKESAQALERAFKLAVETCKKVQE
jgi:hypothetical protein